MRSHSPQTEKLREREREGGEKGAEGNGNRIRFPEGLYRPWACRQSVQNGPIINLPRSQCSARMQRTSATCYFAYNDAAVHANAHNHPGDDIKRYRAALRRRYPRPEAIRDEGTLFRPLRHRAPTRQEKRERKKRGIVSLAGRFSRRETAAGKRADLARIPRTPSPGKITSVRAARRRPSKCENRRP